MDQGGFGLLLFNIQGKGEVSQLAEVARRIYNARRQRERLLGPRLFSDPAWDILLDLFIQGEEGRQVSVSSLCIAACAPTSTALRWIGIVEQDGLLERVADQADARRTFVRLTQLGHEKMMTYLISVGQE